MYEPKEGSKPYLFLELANPDDQTGWSEIVNKDKFIGKYAVLNHTNGGDWCRADSSLCKNYILKKIRKNNSGKGKIISYQLAGYNTDNKKDSSIRADIRKKIKNQRCSVLDIAKPEIDHKDGRGYDKTIQNSENQTIDHFQPLNRNVNLAKRSHCKKCKESNIRFDAKALGYKESVWVGDLNYLRSCQGCYWHDPKLFNKEISKNFTKKY